MNNQTFKNDPADRSDEAKNELEKQLRSVWQGFQYSNSLNATSHPAPTSQ